jgi:hypothetical protein
MIATFLVLVGDKGHVTIKSPLAIEAPRWRPLSDNQWEIKHPTRRRAQISLNMVTFAVLNPVKTVAGALPCWVWGRRASPDRA